MDCLKNDIIYLYGAQVNSKLEDDKQFTYTVSLDNKTVVVEGASVDSDAIGAKLQKWADLKEKSYEFKGQV